MRRHAVQRSLRHVRPAPRWVSVVWRPGGLLPHRPTPAAAGPRWQPGLWPSQRRAQHSGPPGGTDIVEAEGPAVTLTELQDIVSSVEGPCEGSDLVDLYQQFLHVRAPQEKLRPVLQQLCVKWRDTVGTLTPQQLCSIYAVHDRLHCYGKEAFRALGKQLLLMDPAQFEIEDVVEVLAINKHYTDHWQAVELNKSYLWDYVLHRHRGRWGTSPVVQVMLHRAEQIPDEELDVADTLGLLDVLVTMDVQRPALLNKLLRRVVDLQPEIDDRTAIRGFRLVAGVRDQTEGSVEAVKQLLARTEAYVRRIQEAERWQEEWRDADPETLPAVADVAGDRRAEIVQQRKAARLAAQDVTNAAMSVAEGMTRFTAQLNADDRRLKAALANRVAKAAQLQGVALQTDPDRFPGPPFLVREVVDTLVALGRAAEIGADFGDPDLGNITATHQSLVTFAMERAKQIPSELYAPQDLIAIMEAKTTLMWRDDDLIHKVADRATATEFMFSPLQVNRIVSAVERMKVLNRNFNNCFYMNQYAFFMIDLIVVFTAGMALLLLVSYLRDRSSDHEEEDEVWG
eukprot:EG_transcript_6820